MAHRTELGGENNLNVLGLSYALAMKASRENEAGESHVIHPPRHMARATHNPTSQSAPFYHLRGSRPEYFSSLALDMKGLSTASSVISIS